jgi:hypothetical protein
MFGNQVAPPRWVEWWYTKGLTFLRARAPAVSPVRTIRFPSPKGLLNIAQKLHPNWSPLASRNPTSFRGFDPSHKPWKRPRNGFSPYGANQNGLKPQKPENCMRPQEEGRYWWPDRFFSCLPSPVAFPPASCYLNRSTSVACQCALRDVFTGHSSLVFAGAQVNIWELFSASCLKYNHQELYL